MPNNPLPNPLPAGSRIHIYVGNGFQRTHTLAAPLHILDEGMVEAVVTALDCESAGSGLCIRCRDFIKRAFAHCLVASEPEQPKIRASCRAEVDAIVDRNDSPIGWTDESVRVLRLLADALDAQQKSIDDIRKRLP